MPQVRVWIKPDTAVLLDDHGYGAHGQRVTTVTVDDVTLHVGGPQNTDAAVVTAAGALIDSLTQLREAARDRIRMAARDEELREHAHEATSEQMLRGGYVPSYDALPDIAVAVVDPRKPSGLRPLTPDEGDWFVRPGEVA